MLAEATQLTNVEIYSGITYGIVAVLGAVPFLLAFSRLVIVFLFHEN